MKRFDDWPERLAAVLQSARRQPFEWGEHDCAVFAAAAVHAMTGEDLLAPFRGAYSDADSARAALRAAGHHSLYHYLCHVFGQPVPRAFAGRGDLALDHGEDGPALGIVTGAQVVFVGEARLAGQALRQGLVEVPRTAVRHFFRVAS